MKKRNRQAELIKQLSDRELTFHLLFTQGLMIGLSIILFWVFQTEWEHYLGLFVIDVKLFIIAVTIGLVVVGIDLILMKVLPAHYYDDGGINERIFSKRSFLNITFLALLIALCEEILFRGIIQTNIGWLWASLIFAVVHIRYWTSWFLIMNVTLLSLTIGWIFEWTGSLLVTIIIHFIIDFLLGLHIRMTSMHGKTVERNVDHG
ncbi:CPBP family intramembrane glutamic endopeptidase [Bacillus spongiae]|uniref:CPBP family intramembrane glutamic endopeptidase n=1 Tax=Bacillus spongiae TaxID=2683610 RepID=A0ABU8HCT7_9BACI